MDVFRLMASGINLTSFDRGIPANGWTSLSWVERFQQPGEFTLKAPLSSNLKNVLPIGGFLAQIASEEIMMIENHQIEQKQGEDPQLVISGRSLFAYLENRIVGGPLTGASDPLKNVVQDYILAANETWEQLVELIDSHLITTAVPSDGLTDVNVFHDCSGTGTSEQRTLKPDTVLSAVLELLKIDDIGLKVVRPSSLTDFTNFVVYQGLNLQDRIRFAWTNGDIEQLDYLFTNKRSKTHARVVGRWVQTTTQNVITTEFRKRTVLIDASDIDERFDAYPTGGDLTNVLAAMEARGKQELWKMNNITISQVDASDNNRWKYRRDFKLGDLVTVDGDFGQSALMRVVEFAEFEDETGFTGQPTLAIPGEN